MRAWYGARVWVLSESRGPIWNLRRGIGQINFINAIEKILSPVLSQKITIHITLVTLLTDFSVIAPRLCLCVVPSAIRLRDRSDRGRYFERRDDVRP